MPSIMVTNPIRPHLNRIATECHLSATPAAIAAKHIRAQLVTFTTSPIARPRSTTAWHAAGNAAQEQLVALKSTVFKAEAPKGFYAQLEQGRVPAWLQPIDLGPKNPMKMWKVIS